MKVASLSVPSSYDAGDGDAYPRLIHALGIDCEPRVRPFHRESFYVTGTHQSHYQNERLTVGHLLFVILLPR